MMVCKSCGAKFRRPHPSVNKCRCGRILNKNGYETGQYDIRLPKEFHIDPERLSKDPHGTFDNVGNCLAKLIPEWAVASREGCKCKDIQDKLNRWGTDNCEKNLELIVQRMKKQKKYLRGAMSMIPDSVAECGVRYLVKKAIKMSRKK